MDFIQRIEDTPNIKNKKKNKYVGKGILNRNRNINPKYLTTPFPNKDRIQNIIPLNIYQTWHTKNLPHNMSRATSLIRINNPKFNYYLFDDADCEDFIRKNFKHDVYDCYKRLIPGAYKADLWRYCILYVYGGIYLDIKYQPHNNFKFINLTEQEHFCLDIDGKNIYNAIMVCKKGNPKCLLAIQLIVQNVKTRYYGVSSLDITGPGLLARCIETTDKSVDMQHVLINNDFNKRIINYKGYAIMIQYPNYLNESKTHSKIDHYSSLWIKRRIYRY